MQQPSTVSTPATTAQPAPTPLAKSEGVIGSSVTGNPMTTATTGTPGGTPVQQPASGSPGSGLGLLLPFVAVMILMLVITSLTGRKEKKKRAEMMSTLARMDRVQTIGGIIGTVVEVEDAEVVLRVDETSNTRIRFSKSAISNVLKKSGGVSSVTEGKPSSAAVSV